MLGLGGLGNINPVKMEKMLKKLNIDMRQLPAKEVVIKTDTHDITITEPEVSVVRMKGRDVFQITGNIVEKAIGDEKAEGAGDKTDTSDVREDDVKMIMEQTGKDKETVETTLRRLNNDLAKTIMELKREDKS